MRCDAGELAPRCWGIGAPVLWNRFMVELVRVFAGGPGLSERESRERVRVAYAKVAEFRPAALVHFHTIVRLDGTEDRATAPGVTVSPKEVCESDPPGRPAEAASTAMPETARPSTFAL
jgi:hypothetical protein